MEFRQIRYFVAVAEEGSILAAARRLHISQPPITRQIHALESHLGVRLFERGPHGAALTAAGSAFLEDARRLLELSRTSVNRSQAASRGDIGQLDVGYMGTAIYDCLPRLLRAFTAAVPGSTVSLTQIAKAKQAEALRSGALHVGVGRFFCEEKGIVVRHLFSERLHVAGDRHWMTGLIKRPTLARLQGRPLILYPKEGRPGFADEVISLLRQSGVEPKVVAIAEDASAALGLAAAGVGLTLVPASVSQLRWPMLELSELTDTRASVPVSIVHLERPRAPILLAFLDVVDTTLRRKS
ncbi:MAG TPA: LysR family transcriptional regulator [Vicinamibacterales bacterium]|nr:LysR family transcriptional regulator [Vicinamibacterales bacterium]